MHSESHTVGAEQVSQDTLEALYQVPTFIYSYKGNTDQLHRTSLVTGEHSSHRVPSYTFKLTVVGVNCLEEAYSSQVEKMNMGVQ
jgi:hypothetical protein